MSSVEYLSLTVNRPTTFPIRKVTFLVLTFVTCFIVSVVFIFIYVQLRENSDQIHSRNYYSVNDGEIFEINKTKSTYSKDDIIPKRPVILLPQSPAKVPLKLVCYYSFPVNSSDLQPDKIEDLCTHINIAFAGIDPNNYSIRLSESQEQVISQIVSLKKLKEELKIVISVGGAGVSNFGVMVLNHQHRKLFIRSLIALLKAQQLDGVDLDWEWPVVDGGAMEKVQFIQLLYEVRQELNRHKKPYILSCAVAAIPTMIDQIYYVHYMAEYVDYINMMGYDYHYYASYYPVTDYNAPMYASSLDSDYLATLNVNYSIQYWVAQGMPRSKIILGMPIYGHSYRLFNGNNHGLHAPASGFGIGQAGFVTYPQLCTFLSSILSSKVWDNQTKVPYAYDFYNWISYEDEASLQYKANYIRQEKLAGGMTYNLNSDDFLGSYGAQQITFPLHRLIRSILLT